METFLSGAAVFVAFCALLYAASLGRRLDENPAEQAMMKINRLDKSLEEIEMAYDELVKRANELSERLLLLEQAAETTASPQDPASDEADS